MKPFNLDIVNIFLILGSAVAAWFFPFELFLFSYAVLGPLHYLTEISWLKKKNYFTRGRFDRYYFWLGELVLLSLPFIPGLHAAWLPMFILAMLFFGAAIFVNTTNLYVRLIAFAAVVLVVAALQGFSFFIIFFTLLVTIIHVFVFTGCFMLFGALKSRSRWGIASLAVYIAAAVALLLGNAGPVFAAGSYVQATYASFASLNVYLLQLFHVGSTNGSATVFSSSAGLAVMRFIAFAYTYHFANWFSKTKVIRWHEVGRAQLAGILVFWMAAVSLYAYDYRLGLLVLLFLSVTHVFLELPLDHITFMGIYKECKQRLLALTPQSST